MGDKKVAYSGVVLFPTGEIGISPEKVARWTEEGYVVHDVFLVTHDGLVSCAEHDAMIVLEKVDSDD